MMNNNNNNDITILELEDVLFKQDQDYITVNTDIILEKKYNKLVIKKYPFYILITDVKVKSMDNDLYHISGDIHGAFSKYEYEKSDFYNERI